MVVAGTFGELPDGVEARCKFGETVTSATAVSPVEVHCVLPEADDPSASVPVRARRIGAVRGGTEKAKLS